MRNELTESKMNNRATLHKISRSMSLAKTLGLTPDNPVRLKITLEMVDERCEFCGKVTTSYRLYDKCFATVCDNCAKRDAGGRRLCPTCAELEKQAQTLRSEPFPASRDGLYSASEPE